MSTIINLDVAKSVERGMWRFTAKFAACLVFLSMALYAIAYTTDIGRDSTDTPNKRSGMTIRYDAMTGCQYLESSRGGLTPRLDKAGKMICDK